MPKRSTMSDQIRRNQTKTVTRRSDPSYVSSLPQLGSWNTAKLLMKKKQHSPRAGFLGDSHTFGLYSNNQATGNMKPNSYPSVLAGLLTNKGYPAQANSVIGGGSATESAQNMDSRMNFGTGWTLSGTTGVGGVFMVNSNAGASGTLSFTPTEIVDTFIVTYVQVTGGGSLDIVATGGSVTPVSTAGVQGPYMSVTVTAPRGMSTVSITKTGGGTVFITGIRAFDSLTKKIVILNMGWSGSTAGNWADVSQPYAAGNQLTYLNQDVTFVCLGTNDWSQSVPVETFRTNLRSIVSKIKVPGRDGIIMSPFPSQISFAALDVQKQFVSVMRNTADEFECLFIDLHSRIGSYEENTGLYYNGRHPNTAGYAYMAEMASGVLV